MPISVRTTNSPNTEIIIELGLVDSTIKGVVSSPSSLLFSSDVNELYFTMYVDDAIYTGKTKTNVYIKFGVTGTDSARYNSIQPQPFVVDYMTNPQNSLITLMMFSGLTQTGLSLRIKVNSASLVY